MSDAHIPEDHNPYPHQPGEWTLTAPDGRQWKADSPLKCAGMEQKERIPADVRLERILDGAHSWGEEAIWLLTNNVGEVIVKVERDGQWIEVIREFASSDLSPISHIVETGGIEEKIKTAYRP